MMATEKNLKSGNSAYLWAFFLFNLFLLISVLVANAYINTELSGKIFLSFRTVGAVVAFIILFVINGQLPSDLKAKLVFFRWKNPLPGCRAFSHHASDDPRVNIQALVNRHGTLPTGPREQNQLWYKIYKEHSNAISVSKSHRDFLLARDLTSMAFLFLVVAGIPTLFISAWPWGFWYLVSLIILFFVMANLAGNHGRRFVTNVLALESIL